MEHGALRTNGITLQETTHSFPLARQLIEPFRPHLVFSVVALKVLIREPNTPAYDVSTNQAPATAGPCNMLSWQTHLIEPY